MTDRLQQLEQQLAAVTAEIAVLKAGKSVPVPPKDEGVRVLHVLDERTDLPNLKEMERLYGAVKHLAPWQFDTRYDYDKPFRGFTASYRWLANKGRTKFSNPKFALSFWLDNCKTWLRARNSVASDVDASMLILATYASGDVVFCPANAHLGTTWELWPCRACRPSRGRGRMAARHDRRRCSN